jgi:hypothetical protein
MSIKKIQPLKTVEKKDDETPEFVGNHVPTWEPSSEPPATFEQDETHNLALPFDVNDPPR